MRQAQTTVARQAGWTTAGPRAGNRWDVHEPHSPEVDGGKRRGRSPGSLPVARTRPAAFPCNQHSGGGVVVLGTEGNQQLRVQLRILRERMTGFPFDPKKRNLCEMKKNVGLRYGRRPGRATPALIFTNPDRSLIFPPKPTVAHEIFHPSLFPSVAGLLHASRPHERFR